VLVKKQDATNFRRASIEKLCGAVYKTKGIPIQDHTGPINSKQSVSRYFPFPGNRDSNYNRLVYEKVTAVYFFTQTIPTPIAYLLCIHMLEIQVAQLLDSVMFTDNPSVVILM
jgi:hypothetical protein